MPGQIVEVPGYGQVEFPAGMDDAAIVKAIKGLEPRTTTEPTQLEADVASLGRAAKAMPGSIAKAGSDLWHTIMHADEIIGTIKEKGFSGTFEAIKDDLAEHYGSIERAKQTFETDPFRFLTDISVPLTGGGAALTKVGLLGAKIARKVVPEVAAKTAGMEASTMRTAAEAGLRGGPEAAELSAAAAGQPLPSAQMVGQAGQVLPQRQALAPFAQAGQELGQAGFVPDAKRLAAAGTAFLTGHPYAAVGTLAAGSPGLMGRASYAAGALERGLGQVPTRLMTRSAIAGLAFDLLKDKEAKKDLSSEERKTLRAATRDTATSVAMAAAQRILASRMARMPPPIAVEEGKEPTSFEQRYGGLGERSVSSTRASSMPMTDPLSGAPMSQTPSPGQASVPKQEQGSPMLSEVPPIKTSELPELRSAQGRTPAEFMWDQLLKGGEVLKKARSESFKAAMGEEFDPSAGLKVAGTVMGGGMLGAQKGALGAAGGKIVTPKGLAIEGKEFTKASRAALEEVERQGKGAGPLDLTGKLRSDVPQTPIPRYEPPRGLSARMQDALKNPEVIKGIHQSMQRGIKMGADKWYHNEPVRQAFIRELGEKEGAREFARFMDYIAATSPRSDVPTNIRNASYYYLMTGRELPSKLPYPYGHLAQTLHRGNISKLEQAMRTGTVGAKHAPEYRGWDIFTNPKPVSFSEDLQGNLIPVAADTHAMRNLSMRTGDPRWLETQISEAIPKGKQPSEFQRTWGEIGRTPKGVMTVTYRPQQLVESGRMSLKEAQEIPSFWVGKPREGEYGAVEQFYSDIAKSLKLAPAEGQSAAWSGAGELTGLGTPPNLTFAEMFNNRVLYTALMRGEKPEDTLRMFIRKQKPLLGFGGTGLLGSRFLKTEDRDEPAGARQ